MKRSLLFPIVFLVSFTVLLGGCTMGTRSRIYATGGNDIALTRYDEAAKSAGPCVKFKESSYLVEAAGKGADPGADARCVSFEIHENLSGASAKTIDVQEYLREEFGSGYRFGSVSVKTKIGFFNWLANVLTLGLANSQTIVITGDRYPLSFTTASE